MSQGHDLSKTAAGIFDSMKKAKDIGRQETEGEEEADSGSGSGKPPEDQQAAN